MLYGPCTSNLHAELVVNVMQNEQRFKALGASTTDVLTNLKFGRIRPFQASKFA